MCRYLSLVLVLAFGVVGCATKKKDDAGNSSLTSESNSGLPMAGAKDSDSNTAGDLRSVNFEYDSYSLTGASRELLKKNTDYLKANPATKIQVEGHCDMRGSTQYNLALGEKRAKAVEKFLIDSGVGKDRLSTISYGKERLLDSSDSESAHAKNRRANFVIVQ